MIQHGGTWKGSKGQKIGMGLEFHFTKAIKIIWPEIVFHKWLTMFIKEFLTKRTVVVIGPASCVAGHTRILNPLTGEQPTIKILCESGIAPTVLTLNGPAQAGVPFVKGIAELFEVTMESGRKFTSTGQHRVATDCGFATVESLRSGQSLLGYEPDRSESNLGLARSIRDEDVSNCSQTVEDFQSDCPPCSRFCGELLPPREAAFQYAAPSQDDAQARNVCQDFLLLDDRGNTLGHSRLGLQSFHPSTDCTFHPSTSTETFLSLLHALKSLSRGDGSFRQPTQFESVTGLLDLTEEPNPCSLSTRRSFCESYSWLGYTVQRDVVASIKPVGRDVFYDISVPNFHHYFAEGAIHHNSGKTLSASLCVLMDYYCFPTQTTVICCSTTRERLEDRCWGEIKSLHKRAKQRFPTLPGYLIQSRQRIITNNRDDGNDGQDFRNGLVGVPALAGGSYVGLGSFVGLKNKRVTLLGDELSLLPKSFVDGISNLDKNDKFLCIGLGNPKDITDALGVLGEPAAHLGGWDGGIDQSPFTKVWETRRPQGVCLQLVGSDSPNLDGKLGIPLLTQEQIDRDVAFYGKDSLWYTMMNAGCMPRGQGSRRVLTRQECDKHGAAKAPVWKDSNRVRGASLDAAYGGVGGDRCVLTFWEFGEEIQQTPPNEPVNISTFVNQPAPPGNKRQIFAVTETMMVPIKNDLGETPTDQIAMFCMKESEKRGVPPENFFYDSGMRTALVQAFARLWSKYTNSIDCGGKPTERKVSADIDVRCCDYYSKFITELWFSVRMTVLSAQFRGLGEDALMEFSSREWTMVGANKTEVEPKDKMKQKMGRSPDLADCIAIALEGARQRGFVIRRLESPKEYVRDDRWKREAADKAKGFWKSGQMVGLN